MCPAEPGGGRGAGAGVLNQAGDEESLGQAGQEQGGGQAVGGGLVAAAVGDALDDLVGAEPAQVVADLAAGVFPSWGARWCRRSRLVKPAGRSARAQQALRRARTRGSVKRIPGM